MVIIAKTIQLSPDTDEKRSFCWLLITLWEEQKVLSHINYSLGYCGIILSLSINERLDSLLIKEFEIV